MKQKKVKSVKKLKKVFLILFKELYLKKSRNERSEKQDKIADFIISATYFTQKIIHYNEFIFYTVKNIFVENTFLLRNCMPWIPRKIFHISRKFTPQTHTTYI